MADKITKSDAEWKQQLSPEQYQVARKAGTEPAFTGKYWDNHEKGRSRIRQNDRERTAEGAGGDSWDGKLASSGLLLS